MRRFFPVEELARDDRFNKTTMRDRMADPRSAMIDKPGRPRPASNRLVPSRPDASDAARALMHGIFVGEIQALEGCGAHLLGLHRWTRRPSPSSSTWPGSAGTRPATSRSA